MFGDIHLISHDNLREFFPAFVSGPVLWEPGLQLGYPAFADPQTQTFYPVKYIFPKTVPGFHCYALIHIFFAAFFTYMLTHKITRALIPSIVAGIIFAFSGSIVGQLTMLPVAVTTSWMPLILLGFYTLILNPSGNIGIIISALAIALSILGGHPQMFVHAILMAGLMVAFFIYHDQKIQWNLVWRAGLALITGIMLAGVLIVPLTELIRFSGRTGVLNVDQLNQFFMPLGHLIRLVHPYLYIWIALQQSGILVYLFFCSQLS